MQLQPFDFNDRAHVTAAAQAWNEACGRDLSITPAFITYNTRPLDGVEMEGRLALEGSQVAGFAIAARMAGYPLVVDPESGWLQALAVKPGFQRRGIGSALLEWAEGWQKKRSARNILLGAGIRPFAPSLPEELACRAFFEQAGYQARGESWDVARDLGDGRPIARHPAPPYADIAAAGPGDARALDEFLAREFPGGWHYKVMSFLKTGGDPADILLLRQVGRVEGFAWITAPGSARPIDRYYPQRLPKPWGQLGPIGVSKGVRGAGWGGLLLQAGLMSLRERGVRGCVIDWTGLLDFYGKYGFKPYRRYWMMEKSL